MTLKELKEEYKTLGVSDKGKRTDIITRIKEAKSVAEETEPVVEAVQEDAPVEEPTTEEKPSEETMDTEEAAPPVEEEEDAPLEGWTLKEFKEECKTLGLSEKGKKADLIDRIKETRADTEEPTSVEEATIEGVSVEETAQVEEAASVEEETSVLKDSPVEENAEKVSEKTTDGLSDSGETTDGLIAKLETVTDALAVDIEVDIEDNEEEATPPVEEGGPLEDWTLKEVKDECKTLRFIR